MEHFCKPGHDYSCHEDKEEQYPDPKGWHCAAPMELPKWRSVSMDLTEACNLACDYCFTHSAHKPRKLSDEMGRRIIDWWVPQLDKNEQAEITWWGGEPLLEWDLLKRMLHYAQEVAKREGVRMIHGGTTNGILYTPERVEWLVKHESAFMVSLDGIQPAHDCSRKFPNGKGSWKIVDRNLREAMKIYPSQRVRSSLSAANVKYFYETVQYLFEDLGMKHIAFSPVYEDNWTEEALETCREQFDLVVKYMVKREKEGHQTTIKHFNDGANLIDKFRFQTPCGAGRFYAGWSVDGYLFPCHRFNKHGLTSAQRDKLTTVLAKPKGKTFEYVNTEFRKSFIETDLGGNWDAGKCKKCSIYCKSTCHGMCYATNYDMSGKINDPGPEHVCKLQKLHEEASRKLKSLADKEGVKILMANKNRNNMGNRKITCVCYGGCYNEGTINEVRHTNDGDSDMSCGCYNATYNGESDQQFRTTKQLQEETEQIIRALSAIRKGAPDGPDKVLEKCIKILKKEHLR